MCTSVRMTYLSCQPESNTAHVQTKRYRRSYLSRKVPSIQATSEATAQQPSKSFNDEQRRSRFVVDDSPADGRHVVMLGIWPDSIGS